MASTQIKVNKAIRSDYCDKIFDVFNDPKFQRKHAPIRFGHSSQNPLEVYYDLMMADFIPVIDALITYSFSI